MHIRQKKATQEITPAEVHTRLARGEQLVLLDVREQFEYQQGHIKGSLLIPLDQLMQRTGELPRDRTIVAVCRSGNRSGVATSMLRQVGFDVINLTGGMLLWAKQGLPVERVR